MAVVTYSWNPDFDFLNKVINTTTAGDQGDPAVATVANVGGGMGGAYNVDFIATWDDPANGGDVRGRLLTAGGVPNLDADFRADSQVGGGAFDSSLAGLSGGGFVEVFAATGSDPGGDIRFVFLEPNFGGGQGAIADSGANDIEPDVAVLADGGFVVTWTRDLGANGSQIVRSVWNGPFDPRAAEELVSNGANGFQSEDSAVTALAGGGFVVAYEERTVLGGIFFGEDELNLRRYDAEGTALDASPMLIDTTGSVNRDVEVLGLKDGGFVVAYADNEFGQGTDIRVRIYDADGSPRIDLGRINNFTAGDQDKPVLALLSNGYFVVGWRNQGSLKLQAFDPSGNEVGVEYQGAFSSMIDASIAGIVDGRLVSVRSSSGSDGSGTSIRASADDLVRTTAGGAAGEMLAGDALIDLMSGGGGNDTMSGAGANDSLAGGVDNDLLTGGAGRDTIDGGPGSDTARFLDKTAPVQVALSGAADAAVTVGSAVEDILRRVENLVGGSAGDTLAGDLFANAFSGRAGNDALSGLGGNDSLEGGLGNDTLAGAAGKDTLSGGIGSDVLTGGLGGDSLNGGAGPDRFDFDATAESGAILVNRDRIGGFTHLADKIDLSTIDAVPGGADDPFVFIGTAAFTAPGQVRVQQVGADAVLRVNTVGISGPEMTIDLANIVASTITGVDFLL